MTDAGDIILEPEIILDTRWVKHGSKFIEESLVKWKRLPQENATWEITQELQDKLINFNREDKVHVTEGGIDKLPKRRSTRVAVPNPKYMD